MKQRLFTIFIIAALAAAICCAQVATGNLRGTVSDSTGGVLPNCTVTITHTATGLGA
jgi:curli biogenesis system outer membrane secretion channel CsgG